MDGVREKTGGRFAIVTDSACDLPRDYLVEHDVELVPLHVRMGGTDLLDLVDVTPEDFYVRLAVSHDPVSTSHPSPAEFAAVYQRLVAEGCVAIVSVHLSGALSGTYAAAKTAARDVSKVARIEVIDTRTASAAEGLVVSQLVASRDAGRGFDDAVAAARRVADEVRLLFVPSPGSRLSRHGRRRSGALGGLRRLSMAYRGARPLMYLDQNGEVCEMSRSVDLSDSTGQIARIMSLTSREKGPLRYVEISAGVPRSLSLLEKPLDTNEFMSTRMAIANVGPALACHVGLGSVGIAFVPESCLSDEGITSEEEAHE